MPVAGDGVLRKGLATCVLVVDNKQAWGRQQERVSCPISALSAGIYEKCAMCCAQRRARWSPLTRPLHLSFVYGYPPGGGLGQSTNLTLSAVQVSLPAYLITAW